MKKYIKSAVRPVELFMKMEASSGILLAACAVIAMFLANSPWSKEYFDILNFKILNLTLQLWINDALMAIFFFVIGMEIKKEIVAGELSSAKKAALPVAAAFGGMIFPALIYVYFNPEYPNVKGWGIPMATDIAFALGVLTMFGKRIPLSLKIFLLAIAIVDDLGAILVIAFFYTKEIHGYGLGIAAIFFGIMALIKTAGVKPYWIYTLLGAIAWLGFLVSGVHATIAGVLIGLLTPLRYRISKTQVATYSPLEELVHLLHPWVSFGIMPIFALANAGIAFDGANLATLLDNPILIGVSVGLIVGKPLGVFLFSYIAVKLKLAKLPTGLDWRNVFAVGLLAGIGFTMSLFISGLALYPDQEIYSKSGIVLGSIVSAALGSVYLAILTRNSKKHI